MVAIPVRLVRSGRRHRIGNAHIVAAMANAGPVLIETEDGPQLQFLGADDRGVELHVVAVPDNRRPGGLVVIHAMPATYTDRGGDD